MILYQELGEESLDDAFWHLYPKHHLMCHIGDRAANPKTEWNYQDETAIGRSKDLAKKCHQCHVHTAMIKKYVAALELEF